MMLNGNSDDTNKIFVGGIPKTAGTADEAREILDKYFSTFGQVKKIEVRRDVAGRSRGFGFVHFAENQAVDKVMENYGSHQILQKPIEVKRYNTYMAKSTANACALARVGQSMGEPIELPAHLRNPNFQFSAKVSSRDQELLGQLMASAMQGEQQPLAAEATVVTARLYAQVAQVVQQAIAEGRVDASGTEQLLAAYGAAGGVVDPTSADLNKLSADATAQQNYLPVPQLGELQELPAVDVEAMLRECAPPPPAMPKNANDLLREMARASISTTGDTVLDEAEVTLASADALLGATEETLRKSNAIIERIRTTTGGKPLSDPMPMPERTKACSHNTEYSSTDTLGEEAEYKLIEKLETMVAKRETIARDAMEQAEAVLGSLGIPSNIVDGLKIAVMTPAPGAAPLGGVPNPTEAAAAQGPGCSLVKELLSDSQQHLSATPSMEAPANALLALLEAKNQPAGEISGMVVPPPPIQPAGGSVGVLVPPPPTQPAGGILAVPVPPPPVPSPFPVPPPPPPQLAGETLAFPVPPPPLQASVEKSGVVVPPPALHATASEKSVLPVPPPPPKPSGESPALLALPPLQPGGGSSAPLPPPPPQLSAENAPSPQTQQEQNAVADEPAAILDAGMDTVAATTADAADEADATGDEARKRGIATVAGATTDKGSCPAVKRRLTQIASEATVANEAAAAAAKQKIAQSLKPPGKRSSMVGTAASALRSMMAARKANPY